jgi:hypothetical protein
MRPDEHACVRARLPLVSTKALVNSAPKSRIREE